jgi:hypothetical protein
MFFAEEENLKVLSNFLRKVSIDIYPEGESKGKYLTVTTEIVRFIHKFPREWDEGCACNIKWIGGQFIRMLGNFNGSKTEEAEKLFLFSYRFLCEFDFMIAAGKELGDDLRVIKNRVEDELPKMHESLRSHITYALYMMPASISKSLLQDITDFRQFNQKKMEAQALKEQWDRELKEQKFEIDKIREKLEEYKNAFNFVGLSKGFAHLKEQKIAEAKSLLFGLWSVGVCLILLPLISGLSAIWGEVYKEVWSLSYLVIFIPLISGEIVLLYFFRVLLHNHRSVNAQKMQIELRQTLCEFIQSYADYSANIKKQDSSALEKFESLIFSGVVSDPEKLPSTYDGLDQLADFIKSIKGTA